MTANIQITPQSAKPLVAIVDDDESVCEATESLMRSIGYEAACFKSAEAFLVAERLKEIKCAILDLKLKGVSGLALQRQLIASNLHIPVIFITAHWDEFTRARALRLGAVAFLRKPCNEAALLHALEAALGTSLTYKRGHIHE
jgi:FixJ family two-component response regulator